MLHLALETGFWPLLTKERGDRVQNVPNAQGFVYSLVLSDFSLWFVLFLCDFVFLGAVAKIDVGAVGEIQPFRAVGENQPQSFVGWQCVAICFVFPLTP